MSDRSIPLHPTLGVNPRMTFCTRCGGEAQELALIGRYNYKLICDCGFTMYGGRGKLTECPGCKRSIYEARKVELEEGERVPAGEHCDACRKQEAEFAEIIKAGGILWRCAEYPAHHGAMRPNDFTRQVRKQLKTPAGPCGVELTKNECPVCRSMTEAG